MRDGHGSHFDDRALDILFRHNIQSFILKVGDYVHDQTNGNGPNTKLNNLYGDARMNLMRHHGTLKFTPAHMNSILVETWEAFKLSSAKITQKAFKENPPPPLSPLYTGTNHQACLASTQQSNREKVDDIRRIAKASVTPIEMEKNPGQLIQWSSWGRREGVEHQGTSSYGQLHMIPWGSVLSCIFIKSRQSRGKWRDRGWYVSTMLQLMKMDSCWTQTPHQVSRWKQ